MKKSLYITFLFFLISITYIHAQFISSVPTGDILPHLTAALYVKGKLPIDESIAPRDIDFATGLGLFNRANIEFVSYWGGAYAFNFAYRLIDEEQGKPRVALGIDNIAPMRYISPYGAGKETRWENSVYKVRNSEQFSAYAVIGKLIGFSDFSVGVGRGKFVGYGTWTQTLNTDYYSDDTHNDAFGIFFKCQIINVKGFKPYFSIDGRNYDYGFRFDHQYFTINGGVITPNSLLVEDFKHSVFDLSVAFYSKSIFRNEKITDIGILKGRVYDEKTVDALSAMITISGKNYYNTIETTSAGSYSIKLKEGIYSIHVETSGYYWKEKTVSISGGGILYCNFKMKKKPKS